MRRSTRILAVLVALLAATVVFAQVRGRGRLQGQVVDKSSGKPLAGATVTISGGNTAPIVAKSNARGQWSALGLTSGAWNIDIEMAGYETLRGTVSVSETQMAPPIKSELVPSVKVEETTVPAGPSVSAVAQEVVDAVMRAQELMKVAEGDSVNGTPATADTVKASNKEAAALIEGALPQVPADTPERIKIRADLQPLLAQAYYRAGEVTKAIEVLKTVFEADRENATNALLLTNLYLENGQLAEGKALLESLPPGSVTDPVVFLNIGILFLNKGGAQDSISYFERAIGLDMTRAEGYYYRGLAYAQTKNVARAKADFEKVLSIAPESPEGRDAKQMLAALK